MKRFNEFIKEENNIIDQDDLGSVYFRGDIRDTSMGYLEDFFWNEDHIRK